MKLYYIVFGGNVSDAFSNLQDAIDSAKQSYNFGYVIVSVDARIEINKLDYPEVKDDNN